VNTLFLIIEVETTRPKKRILPEWLAEPASASLPVKLEKKSPKTEIKEAKTNLSNENNKAKQAKIFHVMNDDDLIQIAKYFDRNSSK
jgi:hypothetical protein